MRYMHVSRLDSECARYFNNLQVPHFSSTWELHPSLTGRLQPTSYSHRTSYFSESIWKWHSKNQFIFWLLTAQEKLVFYILGRRIVIFFFLIYSCHKLRRDAADLQVVENQPLTPETQGCTSAWCRLSPAPLRQWLLGQALHRTHAGDSTGERKTWQGLPLTGEGSGKDCNCCIITQSCYLLHRAPLPLPAAIIHGYVNKP